MKFTKMQGCGNDFVVLDYEEFLKMDCSMDEVARKLCDRNFGIGADGLIIPNLETEDVDIGWFFYNSDGTTAQMCGNGMRCFAKYVYDNAEEGDLVITLGCGDIYKAAHIVQEKLG